MSFIILLLIPVLLIFILNVIAKDELKRRKNRDNAIKRYSKKYGQELYRPSNKKGFIYIFINMTTPGGIKIGATTRSPLIRIEELKLQTNYRNNIFRPHSWFEVNKVFELELILHKKLKSLNLWGEVFNIAPERAIEEIKKEANKNKIIILNENRLSNLQKIKYFKLNKYLKDKIKKFLV